MKGFWSRQREGELAGKVGSSLAIPVISHHFCRNSSCHNYFFFLPTPFPNPVILYSVCASRQF